jgi:hypothetical protein
MRLQELLEQKFSPRKEDELAADGKLSPMSVGHKKTIDIIGLANIVGRNFVVLGPNADLIKHKLRQVGLYRPNLEDYLTSLAEQSGPDHCVKNALLNWIKNYEPETFAELQIRQLPEDPVTHKPTEFGKSQYHNEDGRYSPIK